jgi:hypothetical protein
MDVFQHNVVLDIRNLVPSKRSFNGSSQSDSVFIMRTLHLRKNILEATVTPREYAL